MSVNDYSWAINHCHDAPTSKNILPCAGFMKDNAIKKSEQILWSDILLWITTCFCFWKTKSRKKNCIKFCNDNFPECKHRRVGAESVWNNLYHSYEIACWGRVIHLRDSAIVHIGITQHDEVRLIHLKLSNIITVIRIFFR